MLEVEVQKAVRAPVPIPLLRGLVSEAAEVPEIAARLPDRADGPSLTVRLAGDRELRRLNREFGEQDQATDVLSFPAGAGQAYLGDIAISWPAARRQAAELGHTPEVEVAFLAVHGLLHLLGWDHATPEDAAEMERLTREVLRRAGLPEIGGRLVSDGGQIPPPRGRFFWRGADPPATRASRHRPLRGL